MALKEFKQCFITGTAAEVTPVCAIDDQEFIVGDEIKKNFCVLYRPC